MNPKKEKEIVYVNPDGKPVFCPQDTHWNAHPRVFLSLSATGDATCPYCGCHYVLKMQESCMSHHKK